MMRPIFNFNSMDNDDPFPPVNQQQAQPRCSMLPRSSIVPPTSNSNRSGRPSLLPNRPSIALSNRPSIIGNRRHSILQQTTAHQPPVQQQTRPPPTRLKLQPPKAFANNGSSKTAVLNGSTAVRKQQVVQPTKSTSKFSAFNEKSSSKDISKKIVLSTESAFLPHQHFVQLETFIETNERELRTQLEEIERMAPFRKLGLIVASADWHMNGEQLGKLLEMCAKMESKRLEITRQRALLEAKRDELVREMDGYGEYLSSELANTSDMKQQIEDLLRKLEVGQGQHLSEGTSHALDELATQQIPLKPEMVDKEVQVVPERTLINSPYFTSSMRKTHLPVSPVLRTGKKERQQQIGNDETVTPVLRGPLGTIESSPEESKENDPLQDSVIGGTPRRWNALDVPIQPLNFDETMTTTIPSKAPHMSTDTTYVISRPVQQTTHLEPKNALASTIEEEIRKPSTPVLLTDIKKQEGKQRNRLHK